MVRVRGRGRVRIRTRVRSRVRLRLNQDVRACLVHTSQLVEHGRCLLAHHLQGLMDCVKARSSR